MTTKELVSKYRGVFNTDYTAYASCKLALLMDADEDPLTDSSGNGNTAALKASGEPDYATGYYTFDGANDICTVTDDDTLDITGDITIVSWSYIHNDENGGYVDKYDKTGSPYAGYAFQYRAYKGAFWSNNIAHWEASDNYWSGGGNDNEWHHVAVTGRGS